MSLAPKWPEWSRLRDLNLPLEDVESFKKFLVGTSAPVLKGELPQDQDGFYVEDLIRWENAVKKKWWPTKENK